MAVAKVIEIISGSRTSFDDAVRQGVAKATDTIADISSAWIKDQSVVVENGKIVEYRVVLKVTFVLRGASKKK
ncbi:MAG: dodecin domain-containing protein [Proteobacteria bacterium]|nr:dodecin domain-containing protein [Pseudomonadota bacterium]